MIHVLFFGPVAERAGCRELQLAFTEGLTVQQVQQLLQQQYPQAFELVCMTALDGEQIGSEDHALTDGCELVFMSRFSGG